MIAYTLRKMLKHLAVLVFVNTVFTFFFRIPKSSYVEYDMKLVKQSTRYIIISATLISISFSAISVLLINLIQWNQNILIVIAGFFISVGAGRQIFATAMDAITTNMNSFLSSWASILHLLAKDRMATTPEWSSIEIQIELLLFGRGLQYELPAKLDRVKSDSPEVSKYLDEHKWELEYVHPITGEDPSYLAFAQHATKHMRDKLRKYDELRGFQQKSGGANTVVLIAIGTLFWLLS
jgi:ABC-type multidrug transport system fused ATPase/permease subunit